MDKEAVTVADQTYNWLRADILSGQLAPGSRLRESQLAASIAVSRTPVRQALHRLDAEGLVSLLPNKGAVVSDWSESDVEQIFELRIMLEGFGAESAARRMAASDLEKLSVLCDQMESELDSAKQPDYERITRLNLELHTIVHEAANNPSLSKLIAVVTQVPLVHHTFHRYSPRELERSFMHHRELVEALSAGDPAWASTVMKTHVSAARAAFRRGAGMSRSGDAETSSIR